MDIVETNKAPQAIGPYSQAIKAGDTLYCSGQIALTPAGEMQSDTLEAEVTQVLSNLKAVVEAGESGVEQIVKTTIYLTNINDFGTVNEIYGQFFGNHKPARATVAVKELPKGARVEIDCIALIP